jgi:hypothetical protein
MKRQRLPELIPLGLLLFLYFALAALVKTAAFRPFLLTRHFIKLSGFAILSALAVSAVLWGIGKVLGGRGEFRKFFVGWCYTLVPTVCWFFGTSLLYLLLPPPRTTKLSGIVFSFVYLTISTVLLLWKIILSYLTLRFGLRLGLGRIVATAAVAAPVIGFYSVVLYRVGVFKVPFL